MICVQNVKAITESEISEVKEKGGQKRKGVKSGVAPFFYPLLRPPNRLVLMEQYLQTSNTGSHSAVVVSPQSLDDVPVGDLAGAVGDIRDQHSRKVLPAVHAFMNLPLIAISFQNILNPNVA